MALQPHTVGPVRTRNKKATLRDSEKHEWGFTRVFVTGDGVQHHFFPTEKQAEAERAKFLSLGYTEMTS